MRANAINSVYRIYQFYSKLYQYKKYVAAGSFVMVYMVLFYMFLKNYFITDFVVWLAFLSVPFILLPEKEEKGSVKHLVLSLFFSVLTFYAGLQTFYFFAIGFAILFVIEAFIGNIGYLPMFLIGLLSPVFKYFNNLFGFPVRLKLSEWSGDLLAFVGYNVKVSGNILELNGTEFSVDPACVGLKMIAVSLLAAIFILAFFQYRMQQKLGFKSIVLVMLMVIALNIGSNLIRILILTSFHILPDNPNHDIVGILCLIIYVIMPAYYFIKFVARKISKTTNVKTSKTESFKKLMFMNVFMLIVLLFACFLKLGKPINSKAIMPDINLKGFSKTIVEGDILKFEKPGLLIYMKPINHFYGAEHNPMICWVGSGYEFSHINTMKVNSKDVYTGILTKGNEKFYSAWWFENGKYQTISQVDWRLQALNGEKFYLVNVNAESENVLKDEVQVMTDNSKAENLLKRP